MKKEVGILFCLILLIFSFSLISADLMIPGYSSIEITNKITNINDFPDYVFISYCNLGSRISDIPKEIKEDGIVPNFYKFCKVSVAAIKKEEFPSQILTSKNRSDIETYINSIENKKVITNITHYESRPDSDPVREINYYYKIEIGKVLTEPNETEIKRDWKIYIYSFGVPLLALTGLIIYLIKRKKK